MSALEIFKVAWSTKNSITLHSIPLLLLPFFIFLLLSWKGFLLDQIAYQINMNRCAIMFISSYICITFGIFLKLTSIWNYKDGKFRDPFIKSLTFIIIILLYHNINPSSSLSVYGKHTTVIIMITVSIIYFISFVSGFLFAVAFSIITKLDLWKKRERIIMYLYGHIIIASIAVTSSIFSVYCKHIYNI